MRYIIYTLKDGIVNAKSIHNDIDSTVASFIGLVTNIVQDLNSALKKPQDVPTDDIPDGYYWNYNHINDLPTANIYLKETTVVKGWAWGSDTVKNSRMIMQCAAVPLENDVQDEPQTIEDEKPKEFEHGMHVLYMTELKKILKKYNPPTVEDIETKLQKSKNDEIAAQNYMTELKKTLKKYNPPTVEDIEAKLKKSKVYFDDPLEINSEFSVVEST